MRRLFRTVLVAAIGLAAALLPAAARAGDITVTVTGVRNDNGNILACLWIAGWGFPDCESALANVQRIAVKATAGSVTFTFADVPDGNYAITIGHDQNGDGVLERHRFMGYPLEGAGASNYSEPPRFAPFHHAATFRATGPLTAISIQMHYP